MVEAILPPSPPSDEGRERNTIRALELAELEARLNAEQGGVVVIHGPRGVGKEQLVADLIRYAEEQAKTVVFQGTTPSAGGRSFHPFTEILQQAMRWADQIGASEEIFDPVLADLEPVLHHHVDAEGGAALDQKLRFFEACRQLASSVSERARALTVVHGLEHADNDTLELATYLADSLFVDPALEPGRGQSGLLVLVVRDDGKTPERVRDFLAECEERRSVKMMKLAGLDLAGIGRYLQSPRLLERLMAVSDGLPNEIDELFDALPSNVEELFERRMASLDAITLEVLRALSLSEQAASARQISSVTGRPIKEVAHALTELKNARILDRRIHNGEIQFHFARRSNLEVCAQRIQVEDRERLHGGWASALAEEPGQQDHGLLAHHQLRSAEPKRGVALAIKAAEAHAVAGAFSRAVELLEAARVHAEGELRLTILERLTDLSKLRGRPREALRFADEWLGILPASQHGKALIRKAELHNQAGDYDQALAAVERARAQLEGDASERLWIECAACEALYQLGDWAEAKATVERALQDAEAHLGETSARMRIELLNLLGKIALAQDDLDRALSIFGETHVLAESSGLVREDARALVNSGLAFMRAGNHEEAEQNLLAGIAKASEGNDLSHLAFGKLNLGVLAHQRGELGRAIECYRACRSLFSRLGNRTQLARVLHNLGNLYLIAGDVARARAHNDEALRLAKERGVERLTAIATLLDGLVLAEEGDRETGETRLREAMVMLRRLGADRPLEAMVELATLRLGEGDAAGAADVLDEAAPMLDQTQNRRLLIRTKLIRGRLELATGVPDAEQHLLEVRDEIAQLEERLLLRDAEVALAQSLALRGQKETALMHLGAATHLQDDVASELPEDLRRTFEQARAQREVNELIESITHPRAESTAPALDSEPLRPSSPPLPIDDDRKAEWKNRYGAIVGRSPKLYKVFHILDRISGSEDTVLIAGESGTGKELVAEAIHRSSPRSKGPFVKLNCAALVESLLLSELFGHERGSFTGAHQRKVGRFEMAAGGTIFLDEIGDISPKTQVSLLRVLQEREFERVGGGRPIRLEARVVCATNRNLQQMVREGTFREDLYYRLKGISLETPPLRERPEDIAELTKHFLLRYGVESGTEPKSLSPSALEMMMRYRWPGNIRELENVIRSVALFADAQTIDVNDFAEYRELFEDAPSFELDGEPSSDLVPTSLPSATPAPRAIASTPPPPPPRTAFTPPTAVVSEKSAAEEMLSKIFEEGVPLAELKRRLQDQAIAEALRKSKGNITRAAEMLGMKRPRLSQIINGSEELRDLCQGVSK